jgi:hypothetical protein
MLSLLFFEKPPTRTAIYNTTLKPVTGGLYLKGASLK